MTNPNPIHYAIIELIATNSPRGLFSGEVRELLAKRGHGPLHQAHLDRRMRELPQWWRIKKHQDGRVTRYSL